MRRILGGAALLAAVVGVLLISEGALASNAIQDDFTATYGSTTGTQLANCSTCHTSVPALNSYGSALSASGLNFAGVEGLDSDGDGFSNLEEIQALTNPGDASDHPAVATSTTSATTTSTTMATSPTASTSTTTTTTTVPPAALAAPGVDTMAFEAGPAGTVWLAVEGGRLVVTNVETTWSYEIEEEVDDDGYEIEIEFRNGEQEVEFEAELEHGRIETEVEVEFDNDDHDDGDERDDRSNRDDYDDDEEDDDEDDDDD